jgi:hypothetical protein
MRLRGESVRVWGGRGGRVGGVGPPSCHIVSRAVPVPGHVLGWRPMARPGHRAVPPVARQLPCGAVLVPGQIDGLQAVQRAACQMAICESYNTYYMHEVSSIRRLGFG